MKYVRAEALKFRRTALGKIWFALPAVSAVLAFLLTSDYFQVDHYNWWYVTLLAGYLPLICSLIVQKDKRLGNRQAAVLPVDLKKCWRAKTIMGIWMLVLSNGCIVLLGGLGGVLMKLSGMQPVVDIGLMQGISAMAVLSITFVWQVPLWLWCTEKMGLFTALLLGIAANMSGSILFAVKDLWYLMPFAAPARLMIPMLHILPNGLPAQAGNQMYRPVLLAGDVIWKGILISILLFAVLEMLTEAWYAGREAK